MCRHCNQLQIFFNRCKLLSHIRSHAFKTATINVSDLQLEPLLYETVVPRTVTVISKPVQPSVAKPTISTVSAGTNKDMDDERCHECHENILGTGHASNDRAAHYMRIYDVQGTHTCQICMFTTRNPCAFSAHLRIHLRRPPYHCPNCGDKLSNRSIAYPYSHKCESFTVMRRSARQKCPSGTCAKIFHPSEIVLHVLRSHTRKLFKCPECVPIYYNAADISKHVKTHGHGNYVTLWQCFLCTHQPVLQTQVENHLVGHIGSLIYTCWACGSYFPEVAELLHHKSVECKQSNCSKVPIPSNINKTALYRVVKRCYQCQQSFTYKCKFTEIEKLPEECPKGCNPGDKALSVSKMESTEETSHQIVCPLCKNRISDDWGDIKKHYGMLHKQYKCLDLVLKVKKLATRLNPSTTKRGKAPVAGGVTKRPLRKRRPNNPITNNIDTSQDSTCLSSDSSNATQNYKFNCSKCNMAFYCKTKFEEHLVSHRDLNTAYQCLECGACYVVKPSFSTHLLLEHEITDVEKYIEEKNCFNAEALLRYRSAAKITAGEPLKLNQCSICREQCFNHDDYEKHFRTHGIAFLLKNTAKKST